MNLVTGLQIGTFVIMVGGLLINWLATNKLTTNHVAHLDEKLDNIQGTVDSIAKEQNKQKTDIAVLKEKTKDL